MKVDHLVSIVIPTFRRPYRLKRALTSAAKQTYQPIEIIVVDDNGINSADNHNTQLALKELDIDNIIYLEHTVNKGASAARNTGIKHAKGEFIAFLDDDDECNDVYIEKMLDSLLSSPSKTGAVYCNYAFYDHRYDRLSSSSSVTTMQWNNGNIYPKLLSGWCPMFLMVKKECFEKVGYFDTSLVSFEDFDLWLRVAQHFEFTYNKEPLVVKHQFENGQQLSLDPDIRLAGYEAFMTKWQDTIVTHLGAHTLSKIQNYYLTPIYNNFTIKYIKSNQRLKACKSLLLYLNRSRFFALNKRLPIYVMSILFGNHFYQYTLNVWAKKKYNKQPSS